MSRAKRFASAKKTSDSLSGWTISQTEEENKSQTVNDAHDLGVAVENADLGVDENSKTQDSDALRANSAEFSSTTVMLMGLLGGLYLLYTWGWFTIANAYSALNSLSAEAGGTIGAAMQNILFWVATLAPVMWFIASYLLGAKKPAKMITYLLLGLIFLAPVPLFISVGA